MQGDQEGAEEYFKREIYDKPKMFITRDLVKSKFKVDRLPTFNEILEYVFGDREVFDSRDAVTKSSWDDFYTTHSDMIGENNYTNAYTTFTAYAQDMKVRKAIDSKKYAELDSLGLDLNDWYHLGPDLQTRIPSYVNDFVVDRVR